MELELLDVAELESSRLHTARMQVRSPKTGKLVDAFVEVYNPDSEEYQNVDVRITDKRMQRARSSSGNLSAEELREMALEKLTGITVRIEGFAQNGEPMESNRSNIYLLYKANPWLRDQVNEFLEDRRNFFKN